MLEEVLYFQFLIMNSVFCTLQNLSHILLSVSPEHYMKTPLYAPTQIDHFIIKKDKSQFFTDACVTQSIIDTDHKAVMRKLEKKTSLEKTQPSNDQSIKKPDVLRFL